MPSKLKRLPYHSFTIILKFESKDDKDQCTQSDEFDKVYAKLAMKTRKYGCKIEPIEN